MRTALYCKLSKKKNSTAPTQFTSRGPQCPSALHLALCICTDIITTHSASATPVPSTRDMYSIQISITQHVCNLHIPKGTGLCRHNKALHQTYCCLFLILFIAEAEFHTLTANVELSNSSTEITLTQSAVILFSLLWRNSSTPGLAASLLRHPGRTQSDTHNRLHSSERAITTSLRPLPTQHTTNTRDTHPYHQRDSNPRSQQSNCHSLTSYINAKR
jgi:hypothetical protein